MLNRRSDLRKCVTMQGATSKMSHNRIVILVVRPLQGRSNEDDLPPQVKTWALSPLCYESEQARAMQMRPRWGLFSIRPCVRSAFFPRFALKAPPFGMSSGRFRSAAEKEQVYRSRNFTSYGINE